MIEKQVNELPLMKKFKAFRKDYDSLPENRYRVYKLMQELSSTLDAKFPRGLNPTRFKSDFVSIEWGNQKFNRMTMDAFVGLVLKANSIAVEEAWANRDKE